MRRTPLPPSAPLLSRGAGVAHAGADPPGDCPADGTGTPSIHPMRVITSVPEMGKFGHLAPQRSKGLVPLVSGYKLRRTATKKGDGRQAGG